MPCEEPVTSARRPFKPNSSRLIFSSRVHLDKPA
jgi:hypothetical protein